MPCRNLRWSVDDSSLVLQVKRLLESAPGIDDDRSGDEPTHVVGQRTVFRTVRPGQTFGDPGPSLRRNRLILVDPLARLLASASALLSR